ncbi:MAG: Holliday junction resolvase RuvX, partial [Clostridia bacterium]|nr:Holliday junction resolvase RuvX [Clostridia bacterium]
ITAQGVKTIKNTGIKKLLAELSEVINEYKPEKIVIGLPKNMDGSEGFRAQATREFAKRLEEIYDGKIIFWDERLSSMGAKRYLNETNTRGKKRKEVLDTVAACIILEGYLTANPF